MSHTLKVKQIDATTWHLEDEGGTKVGAVNYPGNDKDNPYHAILVGVGDIRQPDRSVGQFPRPEQAFVAIGREWRHQLQEKGEWQ